MSDIAPQQNLKLSSEEPAGNSPTAGSSILTSYSNIRKELKTLFRSSFNEDYFQEIVCLILEGKRQPAEGQTYYEYIRNQMFFQFKTNCKNKIKEKNLVKKLAERENIRSLFLSSEIIDLKTALEKLNPKEQKYIYYKYYCNMTYTELSEKMNVSSESARVRIMRIKIKIKALL